MRCRGVHESANAAYLKEFPFSTLLSVARYCVPGGIRVVSGGATATVRQQVQWQALAHFGATIRRHLFLGVAVSCRIGLDKLISLLTVAHHCSVLRAEWCQEWCQKYANFTSQFVFQASRNLHASHPSTNDALDRVAAWQPDRWCHHIAEARPLELCTQRRTNEVGGGRP